MSELNSEQKNYKEAYTYLLKGIELFEIQNSAQTNSDIAKVEEENLKKQKQLEIDLVNQQKEAETKIKNISFVALGVSFLLICGIVFSLLKISRSKKIISLQKQETELQKHLVEEKQKEITDSINYASRIQNAKLPQKQEIYSAFPGCFVLFKPKDIVSGDFYFFHKEGKTPFIAAADCTGHGVPGAFMSMIGSEQLNDAVSKTKDTSEVLKQLNKGIKASLRQSESDESTRDGMDIALCSVDTQNRIVKYAGANRPVWIIRSGQTEVEEIKATKVAIGGLTNDDQHFETHEIKLQEDDTFYICTDGYADQFSGKDGKKLMTRRFKEILVGIQNMTMPEQEQYLDTFVEDWKAGTEQVDDILVIGIRV
jgi:serine phosphatase RsbU (regulator of sigma subunit)